MKKKIFIFGIFLLILDQLLKQVVLNNIPYQKIITVIPNFFYLTNVKNTGGAFSILTGNIIFLLVVGIIFLCGFLYYLSKIESFSFLEVLYSSFIIGGILGNMIDRLWYHGVIDYIGFTFGKYHFPIFNLADILIVCGGFLWIIQELGGREDGNRS